MKNIFSDNALHFGAASVELGRSEHLLARVTKSDFIRFEGLTLNFKPALARTGFSLATNRTRQFGLKPLGRVRNPGNKVSFCVGPARGCELLEREQICLQSQADSLAKSGARHCGSRMPRKPDTESRSLLEVAVARSLVGAAIATCRSPVREVSEGRRKEKARNRMKWKSYGDKLKDPRWQKKRLKILERDRWKCVVTGRADLTLHVHHRKYEGEPWDCPDEFLETICEPIHKIVSAVAKKLPDGIAFKAKDLFDAARLATEYTKKTGDKGWRAEMMLFSHLDKLYRAEFEAAIDVPKDWVSEIKPRLTAG